MAAKKKNEENPVENAENKTETETQKNSDAGNPTTPGTENSADKCQTVQEQQNEQNDKYLRLLAEYDNYRKRSAKERDNIYTDVRVDTVTKFLPVFDNLERALAVETTDEAFRKGVEMTFNQLKEVMTKLGVEEIEAVGKNFDPAFHNAVMHIQDESLGENIVVEEFQKGFRIGDKVIRFSMVKVAN